MFDLGWGELLVIGIVALIAIGPKELPTVLRSVGQWMGKIKRMAGDFQGQFQEALREAEMADLKKHADELTTAVTDATKFDNPFDDIDNDTFSSSEPAQSAESVGSHVDESSHVGETSGAIGEVSKPAQSEAHAADTAPAPESAAVAQSEPEVLPPIDVPPPEAPEPVTEKDLASVEPPPKQAGGTA